MRDEQNKEIESIDPNNFTDSIEIVGFIVLAGTFGYGCYITLVAFIDRFF